MILAAIAKLLLYGGVTIVAGEIAVQPRATSATSMAFGERLRPTVRAGWIALCIGTVVVLFGQARDLELEMAADAFGVLLGTRWGSGWVFLALSVLLGTAAFTTRRGVWARPLLVGCVAAGLGGLGHAAADEAWPRASRLLHAVHVMCVGGWIGGLYLVARVGASATPEAMWPAFSRTASFLAPLVFLTGVLTSLLRLNDATFSAAITSDYGRLLLLKSAFALVVLALGATHRRRLLNGSRPRASSVRVELSFAVLVFLVTSVLAGTAPPGE